MSLSHDKRDLLTVLKLIRKYNLKGTEDLLKQEAHLGEDIEENCETDANCVISAYDGEGDPEIFENAYKELRNLVEESLDIYKHELSLVLYPILAHIYIKLIRSCNYDAAKRILEKFAAEQGPHFHDDIRNLLQIMNKQQLENCELVKALENEKFIIRMSRDTLSLLKRHIQDKKTDAISQIVNKNLYFDLYEGVARSKIQCEASAGGIVGEAKRQDNKVRVYYGLLKEIDFQTLTTPPEEEEDIDTDALDKPKKKKSKKDPLFAKKSKSDPNAPPHDRIPLPELKDADKLEKLKAIREASKRVNLGKDCLPSVCFYTVLNASLNVTW